MNNKIIIGVALLVIAIGVNQHIHYDLMLKGSNSFNYGEKIKPSDLFQKEKGDTYRFKPEFVDTSKTGKTEGKNSNKTPNSTKKPPTPETPIPEKPKLIHHGWGFPTATYVAQNIRSMEKMPVDGLAVRIDNDYSRYVMSDQPVSYETFKANLQPLIGLNSSTLKYNFVIVHSTPVGDIYDDNKWNVTINNFANLAKAAKETGLQGIFFDNEEYFGATMMYPDNCANHTVKECQEQARVRGKQIMEAIINEWSNVELIALHGPYLSENKTADYLDSVGIPYNNVAWANELKSSFVIGMVEAVVGTNALLIDGGEIYQARTLKNFQDIKYWQKEGMAKESDLIPTALKPYWSKNVSSSFGIYDQPLPGLGIEMNVNDWESTITNAMQVADDYVWLYSEKYDWWNIGHPSTPIPQDWIDATIRAKNNAP